MKKQGGKREGSGRPKKPPNEKRVKVAITLTPDHHQKTDGDRSKIIEQALNLFFEASQ